MAHLALPVVGKSDCISLLHGVIVVMLVVTEGLHMALRIALRAGLAHIALDQSKRLWHSIGRPAEVSVDA